MAGKGEIFYTQVDENLQQELIERAKAGFISRTNKQLDFMFGKIANIQLIAYKNQQHKETETANDILGILGGNSAVNITNKQQSFSGNISPAMMPGSYLNPNFKYTRKQTGGDTNDNSEKTNTFSDHTILPYITGADVSLNDGTNGTTNTAAISIVVPNPIRDLDYIESTFMRPGRAITLKIEHPDSAVISNKQLNESPNALQSELPKTAANTNRKMNSAIYDMLVISFSLSYEQNGSVTVTLHLRGTSGVYTDVSAIITQSTGSVEDKPILTPLYKSLHDDIQLLAKAEETSNKTKVLYGSIKASDVTKNINPHNDKWWMRLMKENTQYTYCTLGFLIEYINKNILQTKQTSLTPNAIIKFNPKITKSKLIEGVVSGYPPNVILDLNDLYGNKTYLDPINELQDKRFRNFDIELTDSEKNSGITKDIIGFPSLIWINTSILSDLDSKNPSVTTVIKTVSEEINKVSGAMINLKLIANPSDLNELILYDSKYINLGGVTPFNIPMSNLSPSGSVVKEFSIEAKLPPSSQALMYAINNSNTISEEETAPYINYLYNNFEVRRVVSQTEKDSKVGPVLQITDEFKSDTAKQGLEQLKSDYEANYKKYDEELTKVKEEYIAAPLNVSLRDKLITALRKKVQYPTPKFQQSNLLNAPRYPHEVTFTIDGINGFRYGDAIEFPILPARYKTQTTFSVLGITHTVNAAGTWNTTVRCMMRPDFSK